jgi:predicted nucleotidyltransferase
MSTISNVIDLACAAKVARMFRGCEPITAVEVFGSVARDGKGDDLDLILIVDEQIAQKFFTAVAAEERYNAELRADRFMQRYFGSAQSRLEIAENVLSEEDQVFGQVFLDSWVEIEFRLDIFLFPSNWRDRLVELQTAMPHADPQFMEKIAGDARPLA